MPLQERCVRNPFELADDYCNRCGLPFSNEFLVYPFGPEKSPLCVACALAMAGVRANAGNRPVVSRKELRQREKARNKRVKAQKSKSPKVSTQPISIDWSLPDDAEVDAEIVGRRAGTDLSKTPAATPAEMSADDTDDDSAEVAESLDWIDRYAGEESTAKKITF